MRRAVLMGASSCLVLCSAWAHAAELEARGPKECPNAAELGFEVERNVHVPLAQAPAVKFVVQMERARAGYVAHIAAAPTEGGDATQRELTSADCRALGDAVVVAITLALGTSDAPAPEQPSPRESRATLDEVPPGDAVASSAAPDVTVAPSNGAASLALRPSLSLALLVDAGSLPAPGLGAALGAELSWGHAQLRALGTFLFEEHTQINGAAAPAPGADLELFAGGLLACTQPFGAGDSAWVVPACLGFELGRLAGVGTSVASPRSGSALWAAPRLDVGAHWSVPNSALRLGLALTAAAPLNRSRFALTEIGTVYRPSSVVGRLSFCIGLGFD